jgi:hypothetical protein
MIREAIDSSKVLPKRVKQFSNFLVVHFAALATNFPLPGVITNAAENTGLPRDCFELHQISREEYERATDGRLTSERPKIDLDLVSVGEIAKEFRQAC